MNVGDPVRVYDELGEWFCEGEITAVEANHVDVDFYDWVQRYERSELNLRIILYSDILVTKPGAGKTITDFR